jgi:hypothetical protein
MNRATGFLAAASSLILTLLLALGLQRERYAGLIQEVTSTGFVVDVLEGPEHQSEEWAKHGIYGGPLPSPPRTMSGELSGTQTSEFVSLTIPAPAGVLQHVVKGAPAEIQHVYVELPGVGPLVGATAYVIGSYEWRGPRGPLYGLFGAAALVPLILWGLGVGIATVHRRAATDSRPATLEC